MGKRFYWKRYIFLSPSRLLGRFLACWWRRPLHWTCSFIAPRVANSDAFFVPNAVSFRSWVELAAAEIRPTFIAAASRAPPEVDAAARRPLMPSGRPQRPRRRRTAFTRWGERVFQRQLQPPTVEKSSLSSTSGDLIKVWRTRYWLLFMYLSPSSRDVVVYVRAISGLITHEANKCWKSRPRFSDFATGKYRGRAVFSLY